MPAVGVITPIKDEADNLPPLIDSVERQSMRPEHWFIVDDGSTDGSTELIAEATADHSWVRCLSGTDSTEYDIGIHYAAILSHAYAALRKADGPPLDYYMVLDGDMELSAGYIETVVSYLEDHDEVVIACGPVYTRTDAGLRFEARSRVHPFGGVTLYDGEFYRAIDGPPLTPCVDSVTKARARMRGYDPRYVTELDERAIQDRPAHGNGDPVANFRTLGTNNYAIGYPPIPAVARGLHFMARTTPTRGLAYLRGYFDEWLDGSPRVTDDEVVRYYYWRKHRDVVERVQNAVANAITG